MFAGELKKQPKEEPVDEPEKTQEHEPLPLPLSAWVEWPMLLLCLSMFLIVPLYFIGFSQSEWREGFIPVRTVNAEYKLVFWLGHASIVVGLAFVALHLKRRFLALPRGLLIFLGLFLGSVLLSTVFAHNVQRAWVSSLLWHFVPVLFALSLAHLNWTRKKISFCLGSLLLGGLASCLVLMDQHYRWTDWSWRLPMHTPSIPAGIIYNHNFAAEYHAPLLPLGLGLVFFLRSKPLKVALVLCLVMVFLPSIALSLARGAWLSLIVACVIATAASYLLAFAVRKRDSNNCFQIGFIPMAFLSLSVALPVCIYTSTYWKKNVPREEKSPPGIPTESVELKKIVEITAPEKGGRRLGLWKDALLASLSSDFLLGKGTDHYELHFHESAKVSDQTTGATLVRFAHNDYVQILYENGFIGLAGFLGIWGWTLRRGFLSCVAKARKGERGELGLMMGLLASTLVFLLEAFFEFPTRSPCALMVGWTLLGLTWGLLLKEKPTGKPLNSVRPNPSLNLGIGALGLFIIPCGCLLAKNLFWTNVYHVQGRVAGDAGDKDKSLRFHRMAISFAPWEHHSRKFECYYLLTHTKQIPDAIEAIERTLEVHPGCLAAHQNKIAVFLNTGRREDAWKAYLQMEKAAPYHHYTDLESKKFIHRK
tara:strand:- start:547 stop:2493 length:1947 start_codon:yes stop_codon:yes gene_type:complete